MKMIYQKPSAEIIDFTLTEAIAASTCVAQMNHGQSDCSLGLDLPGISFNFGEGEDCSEPVEGYCYFTSSNMMFSS